MAEVSRPRIAAGPIVITGLSFALALGASPLSVRAQCQLLVRESFRPGDRPHGGNGRIRPAQIHDTLAGYWPQTPADGSMWMSNDQSGVANWGFAGSSLDPAEVDPQDPYNGTAFGDAPAAALLPFAPPTTAFTTSAEAVMGLGSTSATYLGYTSSPVLLSNFELHGALWMSLNGRGDWAILANGATVVASGTAPVVGVLDSGWLHMEFTFDPATSMVSGRVMNTVIPPTPVSLSNPILYFGMEAHESWNVLNNLSISTGPMLTVSAVVSGAVCPGGAASFSATTNATDPSRITWTRSDGWPLADGPQPDGSVISGSQTSTMTITGATPATAGDYRCFVANDCGSAISDAATLTVGGPACCIADFNQDGALNADDLGDFITGYFNSPSDPATDFNADGIINADDLGDFITAYFNGC